MRRVFVGMLLLIAGCGGGNHTACKGSACMKVGADYDATASASSGMNTCKNIVYGGVGSTMGMFDAPFTVTQDGADPSKLTFLFDGAGLTFTVSGTLFADNTAEFKADLPHITVFSPSGNLDYQDNTSVFLTFTPSADKTVQITGTLQDILTANQVVMEDSACSLGASLSGKSATVPQ